MRMRTMIENEDEDEDEDLGKYFCARILFMSFKCFPPIRACMMSRYCWKITFLAWVAFSSNHWVLSTILSYLCIPTKRQTSLCSWVKFWTDEKTEIFYKVEGCVHVHEMVCCTQWHSKLPNKMQTQSSLLPSHQAFHQPSGDPRAHEPNRSRIWIRIIVFLNQGKINAFLPPSAGLFSRVHEWDLVEEIVEVKTDIHLNGLRLLHFTSIVPVITVSIVTITTIIFRLFRLGSWCLLPEKT